MTSFLARRSATMIITLLLVSVMIFLIFRVIPGDPALIILGTEADEAQIHALQEQMGTNQPLWQQFGGWLGGLWHGELGESLRFSMPVEQLILDRLPVSIPLALLSMAFTLLVGLPLGVFLARHRGQGIDLALSFLTQLGMAVPSFWAGILLMLLFAVVLHTFAVGEFVPWQQSPWGALRSLLLPAVAIALPQIAVVVRYVRSGIIDQMGQDYVRTAYGKGLAEGRVYYRHALRNALIPLTTVLGMIFADVIAGTIIVEQVFALPGIGRLLITAVSSRDFPLIQGLALYITLIVVSTNFLIDLLYSVLDPRIRLS
jgi:peptide/nickel transport system permease protein